MDIHKGQTLRHADLGRVVVKRVKKSGAVTVELLEGIRAGQWYDANPTRLTAEEERI